VHDVYAKAAVVAVARVLPRSERVVALHVDLAELLGRRPG